MLDAINWGNRDQQTFATLNDLDGPNAQRDELEEINAQEEAERKRLEEERFR